MGTETDNDGVVPQYDPDAPELRPLLIRALRDDGFKALCRGESRSNTEISTLTSYTVMVGFGLGVASVLADWLDIGILAWLGLLAVACLVLALIGVWVGVQAAAALLVLAWFVLAAGQVLQSDHDLLATVVWPFAVVAAVLWIVRRHRLTTVARTSPLLLAVTITILLIPLFTDDLWRAADDLGLRHLGLLAAVTILPLLLSLAHRLRAEVGGVLSRATTEILAARHAAAERAGERILRLLEDDDRNRESEKLAEQLGEVYGDTVSVEHAQRIEAALLRPLRRQVVRRLLVTTFGLLVSVTLYLYVLAWILVPIGVSAEWLGEPASTTTISLLNGEFAVPLGGYVSVAGLLGIVATAVMLAFATTEDRYAGDVTTAVLYAPLRDGMTIALPYQALKDSSADVPAR
ncbi:hypothetical protein [Conexibacter woesei]|uniref:hypothetical protein n=1 Tax=Conexibacter woesei TaxID=191495 RepID=UPI0011D2A540|nr:hypothetical protein [Conexibacter woesei]